MLKSILSSRIIFRRQKYVITRRHLYQQIKGKIKRQGVGTFSLYGCIDGTIFLSTTIFMSCVQDRVMKFLEQSEWIKNKCPSGDVTEEIIKKSKSVSNWAMVRPFGLDGSDFVAFGCAFILLRNPFVRYLYVPTVGACAAYISGTCRFQSIFGGSKSLVLLLIPMTYLGCILTYKSQAK